MMNLWIQCLEIKKWRNRNLNINLDEIRYLGVTDITDYKLEFITEKFKTMDPIWRTEIIKIVLDEIQYTEVFAVADAKTREIMIW